MLTKAVSVLRALPELAVTIAGVIIGNELGYVLTRAFPLAIGDKTQVFGAILARSLIGCGALFVGWYMWKLALGQRSSYSTLKYLGFVLIGSLLFYGGVEMLIYLSDRLSMIGTIYEVPSQEVPLPNRESSLGWVYHV